jgi:RNA polymerase sigma-70 factor, ECF subfamily
LAAVARFCEWTREFGLSVTVAIDEDDERTLVAAAQADPARFEELYDRYVHRVYGFVSRRVGNRATAEDITSAVFEQALDHLPKFEWRGVPFAAWLIRIAANAVVDHWRRAARETGDAVPEVPDAGEVDAIEQRAILFQLVGRLPELQRRVIELRFGEEKSIREVAAALQRTDGAVKQLQLRALENLRKGMRHG